MQIHGPTHVHGAHGINAPHAPFRSQTAQGTPGTHSADRVDISAAAEAAMRASESSEIRHDLVNQIRSQITAGTYETPAKLEAALERLLNELG